jgi:iron complex outermembrane receptor protein
MGGDVMKYALMAACSLAAFPAAALAQAANSVAVDEVVVTAQKRAESLQSVAAAVTAVSGDALATAGVTDQTQLTKLAPGLVIADQGGLGFAFMRGVGQTLPTPNAAPGVAFNFDGMYVPSESGFTPVFDLERVEVLPGPQGTLYGRASAGGAINYVTAKPDQEFGGNLRGEVGDYSAGMLSGAVNLPLGSDFALRLSGMARSHDGYLSNGLDDEKISAGRAILGYHPDGPFSGTVTLQHHHEGGKGHSAIVYNGDQPAPLYPDPSDPYTTGIADIGQRYRADVTLLTAELNLDLGENLTLTYIPGYAKVEKTQRTLLFAIIPAELRSEVEQTSHELRLAGENQRGDWVAGLYYLHSPRFFGSDLGFIGQYIMENEVTSYAAFAEYRYKATDNVTLTLGGRYSYDEHDGRNFQSVPPFQANPLNAPSTDEQGHTDFKLGAEYRINPDIMVYGTIQTGYIPSGFADGGVPFEPSELTSYTVGAKNRFFDDRLTANLELFFYEYENFQLQFYQPDFSFGSASVPARIVGGELNLALRLTDNDLLGLNVLVQHATMRDRTNLYDRDGRLVSIYKYQLPYAPNYTVNGSWSHTFPLANDSRIVAQANVMLSDSYWQQFTHDTNTRQEAHSKTDLMVTYYAPNDRWNVGAFVRNVEDEPVFVGTNKPAFAGGPAGPFLRPPRTYGISFGANF